MANVNKKTKGKACDRPTCVGCQPPRKFAFKIEGDFELPAFWNADAAEQILTNAVESALNSLAIGRTRDTISYSVYVFEDVTSRKW
jgi:hypothetical protein